MMFKLTRKSVVMNMHKRVMIFLIFVVTKMMSSKE